MGVPTAGVSKLGQIVALAKSHVSNVPAANPVSVARYCRLPASASRRPCAICLA